MNCGLRIADCGLMSLVDDCAPIRNRKGLAPLELVLAMPMLMAVMALMIVFGHAAYWKVRGLTVTRNAAWSNRWPRTGFDEPTPRPWTPGQYARRGANNLEALDDPVLQHPVVRGPLPNGFNVNEQLLDMGRGMTEGHAQAKIEPAMMPKLKHFEYTLEQSLLDGKFQYPQMGIPANVFRRIPFIYELPKVDMGISQAWVSATLAVMNAPFKPQLQPLDHDEEAFSHYGYYPDFHPRLRRFCHLDLRSAWENQTRQLIGQIKGRQQPRIRGVPETMTRFWIRMYQSQVNGWQAQINELQNRINMLDPIADAAEIARLQAQIDGLQAQIDVLTPQLGVLQAFLARLRAMADTADGPVPPLAALSDGAGNLASGAPLRPIPEAFFQAIGSTQTACCGAESSLEELLRLMETDASLAESLE
jgi:hypothetical protein